MPRTRRIKKKCKDKGHAQKAHFKKRVFKRLNFHITSQEMKELTFFVEEGKHIPNIIFKQSHRVIGFRYNLRGKTIVVIWDNTRHSPITAMLENWIRQKYQKVINYNEVIDLTV